MNSDLALLLKLQVIDYDIGELERSKEYLPDMIDNLNQEMSESQEKYSNAVTSLDSSKGRQKTLELELASKEASLQKYQQQMMSIKTNKEYDALVAEIDAVKQGISTEETELLQVIEMAEALEKEIGDLKLSWDGISENNSKQLSILQEKIDSIGDVMSGKEGNRREVVGDIPKRVLSVYERVRRGKGGQVVVSVKKRACGSCFKALTPKKVQEIKRADRVDTCDHCGSIIYWDEPVSD